MSANTHNRAADALLNKHPLQRLPSPSRSTSAAIHLIGLSSFAYSFQYLVQNPNPINNAYGWHFQYLTIIGLSLTTVTFVLGFLADATMSYRLFLAKNAASVVSAPMEVLIMALYWGLRAVDPDLVVDPRLPALPMETDLSFHLLPGLLLAVDLLLLSPPWTISTLPSCLASGSIATLYWFWVELCYSKNGFYPYPIFNFGFLHRLFLFIASALVMTANTLLLKMMYRYVNGESPSKAFRNSRH